MVKMNNGNRDRKTNKRNVVDTAAAAPRVEWNERKEMCSYELLSSAATAAEDCDYRLPNPKSQYLPTRYTMRLLVVAEDRPHRNCEPENKREREMHPSKMRRRERENRE